MNGIEMMSPSDIHPYEKNPRINDEAVKYVANSIREFGFRQPIVVDKHMTIIVGHTRWKAAKKLGLKKVPVLVADDLTPEQAAAYRIADNSTADVSEWDTMTLADEISLIDDYDMNDFAIDVSQFDSETSPSVQDVLTKPFRKAYVLVVADVDSYDAIADKIHEIDGCPGVEVTHVTKTD